MAIGQQSIGPSLTLSSFLNEAEGANIASATPNIGAATGNYVNITGTTTITAFDTVQAGTRRIVNFNGALTLTYNATSLILPGAANIITIAGDTAIFVSLGSGNWICTSYQSNDNGVWKTDWTPTFTGFSAIPTAFVSRYVLMGKTCTCELSCTAGTSNATTKTVTLPFAAANTSTINFMVIIVNNSTAAIGRLITRANSNIADVYISVAAAAWTNTGSANIQWGGLTYETA